MMEIAFSAQYKGARNQNELYITCARLFCILMALFISHSASATPQSIQTPKITLKPVDGFHFFYSPITADESQFKEKVESKALKMSLKLAKRSRAKIDGPFMMRYQELNKQSGGVIVADIGFPVTLKTKRLSPFKYRKVKNFLCASLIFNGKSNAIAGQWKVLYQYIHDNQLTLDGESRMLIISPETNGKIEVELQLGITELTGRNSKNELPKNTEKTA